MLVGNESARRRLIIFEDLQCPFCRQFEERSGDMLRREIAAGAVAIEYRIRSFLGPESARAANALAAAAEQGCFDQLRRELFASQPAENTGGYSSNDLIAAGARAGITDNDYAKAVSEARYESWVHHCENVFRGQDPDGTPAAILDGDPIDSQLLYDPQLLGDQIRS